MKSSAPKVRPAEKKLRLLAVLSDRTNLVLDVGGELHDAGLDLVKLRGTTCNGRFILAFSAIGKSDLCKFADRFAKRFGGEIVATIDDCPYVPRRSLLSSLRRLRSKPSCASENGLLMLGRPDHKAWAEFRQTLVTGVRKISTLAEFALRDAEGEIQDLDWAAAAYEFQSGPRPMNLLHSLEAGFHGQGRLVQMPKAMAIPAFKLRREVTVQYFAHDIQGVFFELMHSIQTARAVVHSCEAEKYKACHFGGLGFASEFQVAVSDVQTQQDLESLFRLRKQLAVDMTVKFGWDKARSIAG